MVIFVYIFKQANWQFSVYLALLSLSLSRHSVLQYEQIESNKQLVSLI